MRLDNIRRIIQEDFKDEDRDLVGRLSNTLNHFMENVVNILNGNVDFDNLSREILTFELTTDKNGDIIGNDKFVNKNGLRGMSAIRVDNVSNTGTYPTSTPFVSFKSNGQGVYQIAHITGLHGDTKYRLLFELIY